MIDLFASEPHYLDHLLPLVPALRELCDVEPRVLVVSELLRRRAFAGGAHDVSIGSPRKAQGRAVVVAAQRDVAWTNNQRRIAYLEHGAGQTYRDAPRHYSGGEGFERVDLFLAPSEHVAERWRWRYPEAVVRAIGCPRLDRFARGQRAPRSDPPTIGLAWHWPCRRSLEAGWAWPEYREAVRALVNDGRWRFLGTAHPRAPEQVWSWYEWHGVPVARDSIDVLTDADVLVADNTSLMYEFAALDRPVVAVRSERWRESIEHGLRFWSHVPGVEVLRPDGLAAGIADALRDLQGHRVREQVVQHVYGGWPDGRASERAARAIGETLL